MPTTLGANLWLTLACRDHAQRSSLWRFIGVKNFRLPHVDTASRGRHWSDDRHRCGAAQRILPLLPRRLDLSLTQSEVFDLRDAVRDEPLLAPSMCSFAMRSTCFSSLNTRFMSYCVTSSRVSYVASCASTSALQT